VLDLLMFMAAEGLPEKEESDSGRGEESSVTQDEKESPSSPPRRSETKGHAPASREDNP